MGVIYRIRRSRLLRKSGVTEDMIAAEILLMKKSSPIMIRDYQNSIGYFVRLRSDRYLRDLGPELGNFEGSAWYHDRSKASYESAIRAADRLRARVYREWALESLYERVRLSGYNPTEMLRTINSIEESAKSKHINKTVSQSCPPVPENQDRVENTSPSIVKTTTVYLSRSMGRRDVLRALKESDLGPYIVPQEIDPQDATTNVELQGLMIRH